MWKVNFAKNIIISLSIVFALVSCNEMDEGNSQLPIKDGDHFAGGEVPALIQEMLDGKIVEIQYTYRFVGGGEYYYKYTLNEKYTKGGDLCFDLSIKMQTEWVIQ